MASGATTTAPDDSSTGAPDLMNDPQYATNSGNGEDGLVEADTCRICRGEATTQEPLFYPCKCSGSIKFVHQDCLMEWLSHSQKKHCELCKTPFRFTKLYASNMPQTLPTHVFFRHLIIHAAKNVAMWLRACLVVSVWLGLLPWLMRHIWGLLFWFGDGGWTSKDFNPSSHSIPVTKALALASEQLASLSSNATSPANPILASPTTSAKAVRILEQLPRFTLNWTASDPLASGFVKFIYRGLGFGEITSEGNTTTMSNVSQITNSHIAMVDRSSVLSEVKFLKALTRYPQFNAILIDTLEGQIITIVVVVCFVLIFLIREWVVQQQPGINMGAGFNAEFAGGDRPARNRIVVPENLPDPIDQDAGAVEGAEGAGDAERRGRDVAGRPIARPRRRHLRFEEANANNPEPQTADQGSFTVASLPSPEEDRGESSKELLKNELDQQLASSSIKGDLSKTHLDASEFVSVWRRAGGNPEEVLRIIEEENLGEKLQYWKNAMKSLRQANLSPIPQPPNSQIASVEAPSYEDNMSVHEQASAAGPNNISQAIEDNSSSDSWVDIPDTPSEINFQGQLLTSEKLMTSATVSGKGKEREAISDVDRRESVFVSGGKSLGYNDHNAPESLFVSQQEDFKTSTLSSNSVPGRPRAVSDGPNLQDSISPLGNNSWSFSDLPSDAVPEPESPLDVWRAEQNRRVQQAVMKGMEEHMQKQGQPSEQFSSLAEFETPPHPRSSDSEGPLEIFNPETGTTTVAENWDEVFARNPPDDDEEVETAGQEYGEMTNNPFHPEGLLPEDAHLLEPRQPVIPPQQENPGVFGSIADWLWGEDPRDGPAPDDEHVVRNLEAEAPFVPVVHNAQDMMADMDDEERDQNRDRELAEALAAGLDPNDPDGMDAMDDAEDFEGIMELVGMRGPLTQLFQNGLFSAVLISLTVACGVWMPYNVGRLFLLLIANPMRTIKGPLKLLFSCAAVLQDLTLVLLGGISFGFIKMFSALKATLFSGPTEPELSTAGIFNWSEAAFKSMKMANSALDRVVDLVINSLVKLTESEIPAFSAMSHEALLQIKSGIFCTLQYVAMLITTAIGSPSGSMRFSGLGAPTTDYKTWFQNVDRVCRQHLIDWGNFLSSADSWVMSLELPRRGTPIDPSLSYWGGTDRFWAVIAGYVAFCFLGAAYLKKRSPFSTSQTGRQWEATIVDILNQAGGVMKVILIISIEMLVFPLYCGLLLDLALLPLFENATVVSRIIFSIETPFTSMFVHWFVGTCYMFHFALFVSMCRKIMRPGVLYFIRDPDDPTFHPVRDVLERNVATQLKKITFSAMVYGALVVVCLGGVVWSLAFAFKGVLPIHWSSNEPVLQFPIDLLFYNFFMPLAVKFFKPSDGLHAMYSWWFRKCARILRLTWFLFDKEKPDEEGHRVRTGLDRVIGPVREGFFEIIRPEDDDAVDELDDVPLSADFQRDGKYVRTPASDQVRIPKGQQVFIEVDENNERTEESRESADNSLDLRSGDMYKRVYIPPSFRTRIFLFILFIWLFAAVTGVCITIVPLVFGRRVFAKIIPTHVRKNDVYAFAIGSYMLGSVLYCVVHLRSGLKYLRDALTINDETPKMIVQKVGSFTLRVLRVVYIYMAFAFVLPTLLTLAVEFYIIIPLHTYFSPSEAHVIHFVQSWTLGLLYVKIGTHLILWLEGSRPAEALRAVTRNGYLDPDIKIATRAFILPATVILTVALTAPLFLAATANHMNIFGVNPETQKLVYRYAYPFSLWLVIHLLGTWYLGWIVAGWRMKIRDEVYLIGERLHNFGDRSKSGAGALIPTGNRIET